MSDPASFAEWLRERRKALDLTQDALAERVGLSPSAVRKFESGQRKPSRQVAQGLAEALRIPQEERASFLRAARGGSDEEEVVPHNLPTQLTSLFGREEDLAALTSLLSSDGIRLVTILGPPGIGKTRLALAAALHLVADREPPLPFPDGVYMVPLAPVREPTGVIRAIAATLGVRDTGQELLSLTVRDHLKAKRQLLVLDNFEQVVSAAPQVSTLLEHCPTLRALVTSREALRVRGERHYYLAPLVTPDPSSQPSPDEMLHYPAIRMFVERARDVSPAFALNRENAPAVAAICTHLDGLPLAIELVAARARILPPTVLLARLKEHKGGGSLGVLTGGPRDLPDRHRTLRDAIGWSYDLLNEGEQALFNRLGVFAGGCTLASAEAVCNAIGDLPLPIFEGLSSLLDKSLLQLQIANLRFRSDEDNPHSAPRTPHPEEARYSMLETIREYAAERLEESREAEKVKGWLAQYYVALAQAAKLQIIGKDQSSWMKRLDAEHDNIRAALRWAIDSNKIDVAALILAGLFYFWYARGHVGEGRAWLEEIIDHEERRGLPESLQAELLNVAGFLASAQYDFEQATRWLDESLALSRQGGDKTATGITLNALGIAETSRGDYARAESVLTEAIAIFNELGEKRRAGVALGNLALAALFRGDPKLAQALALEGLLLVRTVGDDWNVGLTLTTLGLALCRQGEHEQALAACNEAIAAFSSLEGKATGEAAPVICLAEVARRQGEYERAEALYKEALSIDREETNYRIMATGLLGLGVLAAVQEQPERAVTLFGILDGWSERLKGTFITPAERPEYEQCLSSTRAALDPTRWTLAWERGRAMSADQAVKYTLGEPGRET